MLNNLDDEQIVIEIRDLIAGIDSVKNEMNIYCDLMKQIFLSGSAKN